MALVLSLGVSACFRVAPGFMRLWFVSCVRHVDRYRECVPSMDRIRDGSARFSFEPEATTPTHGTATLRRMSLSHRLSRPAPPLQTWTSDRSPGGTARSFRLPSSAQFSRQFWSCCFGFLSCPVLIVEVHLLFGRRTPRLLSERSCEGRCHGTAQPRGTCDVSRFVRSGRAGVTPRASSA